MKIIQVVPSISSESSGPSYSVTNLCKYLAIAGADVELHTLDSSACSINDVKLFYYPRNKFLIKKLGFSASMLRGLSKACFSADVIHSNSLWMMPNVYPGWAKRNTKCKLVISPRGTLAAWSLNRSKFYKTIFGLVLQNHVLRNADMFHATCAKEVDEIRNAGFTQPIAMIPIGIDIRNITHENMINRKTLLFLGRIHPVKGVDNLVKAWALIYRSFPEWDLKIVGPDAGGLEQLKHIIANNRIERVFFEGEQKGEAKFKCYAEADIYVLPSYTENFGVSVAEALSCGLPVVVSKGTPWKGVENKKCGWWCENTIDELASVLRQAMSMPSETLRIMGINGKKWMECDFSWTSIGRKMLAAYKWLVNNSENEKPNFIFE